MEIVGGTGYALLVMILGLALVVGHRSIGGAIERREGHPGGYQYFIAVAGLGMVVSAAFFLIV